MKEKQQEKKKTTKHRDPAKYSRYRTWKSRELRKEAAALRREAKEVVSAVENDRKSLRSAKKRTEALAKARHTADYLLNRAEDLEKKATRVASGYKRSHHKMACWKKIALSQPRKGWDLLSEKTFDQRCRRITVGIVVAAIKVSTDSGIKVFKGKGHTEEDYVPMIPVAWDRRTHNPDGTHDVPNAPRRGVYHLVSV